MNTTVMNLTARTLLGRRRALLLLVLPVALVGLAVVVRLVAGADDGAAIAVVGGFGLGTVVPLVALLVGTGVIGPEIDDGAIVYLLSKPINRFTIVLSKLAVAVATALAFGAVPVFVATVVLANSAGELAPALAAAAAVASCVYCTFFLLLAILTRSAVLVGLLYAIVWETTIAGLVPGAKALSVRQWSLSVAQQMLGTDAAAKFGVDAAVGVGVGVVALAALAVGCTTFAGMRLRSLRLLTTE